MMVKTCTVYMMVINMHSMHDGEETFTVYMMVKNMYNIHDSDKHGQYT